MKGKRYTTEDKIRILREADRGEKSLQDICRDANLSVVSFHRWKKQFGHMASNEARRLKELERAMKAADVLHWLRKAVEQHGASEYLRSDNGSEFIAKTVQRWLKEYSIKTIYIEPGSPWQNGFVESFHGRFRDECLNREQLWTLTESRVVVGDYRQKYNQVRPHSRLGYESPAVFAARSCPSPAPVELRPPYAGDGQRTNENINSTMSQD